MTINDILECCYSLKGVEEKMPFGEGTLVLTVGGKIFALMDIDAFSLINLKCDPETAIDLRERYEHVTPGYHMSKKHWNSVLFPNNIPDRLIYEWIRHSYDLVFSGLPKKLQKEIIES